MSDSQDSKQNNGLYEERRVYGTKKQKEQLYAAGTPVREKKKPRNDHFVIIAVVVMAVFMLTITIGIAGFFKKPAAPSGKSGKNTAQDSEKKEIRDFYGVVLEVNKDEKTITVYDVKREEETTINYDGGSKFYGTAGTLVTAAILEQGDLMHFTCREWDSETLDKAEWSSEFWEKQKIDDLEIYPEEHRMVIRNVNYKYSDGLCIMSNGERAKIEDLLTTADRYTIRGEGTTVYEIIVTIGHGSITLLNYGDYYGGLIIIGDRYAMDVKEPATYVVREGTYRVEVSNGRLNVFQTIEIGRNREVYFNLKP